MDGWNTSVLLGWLIFKGELLVSGSVVDENFKSLAQATSLECRHVQVADACKGPAVAEMPCFFVGRSSESFGKTRKADKLALKSTIYIPFRN